MTTTNLPARVSWMHEIKNEQNKRFQKRTGTLIEIRENGTVGVIVSDINKKKCRIATDRLTQIKSHH